MRQKKPKYETNPLAVSYPNIRFYAGAPIILPLGERIGSLCVIDIKLSKLNIYQRAALEGLAKVISHTLLIRNCNNRANAKPINREHKSVIQFKPM